MLYLIAWLDLAEPDVVDNESIEVVIRCPSVFTFGDNQLLRQRQIPKRQEIVSAHDDDEKNGESAAHILLTTINATEVSPCAAVSTFVNISCIDSKCCWVGHVE